MVIPNARSLISALAACLAGTGWAAAEDWTVDRFHLFYSNDSNAAPRLDRWRTVALSGEWLFEHGHARQVGVQLGAEIIAPERLSPSGIPIDRAFAGLLQVKFRDYRKFDWLETRFGAGSSVVGPQTGLSDFLDAAHEILGGAPVSAFTANTQVPNEVYLDLGGEVAAQIPLNGATVRPFVEAMAGVETYARAGIDVSFSGEVGLQRMPVTGALMGSAPDGWSVTGGFDVTHVMQSGLIPAGRPVTLKQERTRVRANLTYGFGDRSIDVGLAWLGPEFKEQSSGQFIGTVGMSFGF